ncbi:Nicotinamide/nicotinic acid mononucleotide adenylyltransferase 1 [Cystobasidiomycetes sp. EMM_F5]
MQGDYIFPTRRLESLRDPTKTPLVLVACGSFSPVTFLHLRMFEMAKDDARLHTKFQVVGGYLSLVNDAYKKPGLAPAPHRYNMCRLACDRTSDWLMVDPWEARSDRYVPTAPVLDHFHEEINKKRGGVPVVDDQGNEIGRKDVRIILLAGSDLIQTMSEPGVWAEEDLHHILGQYGTYIIERAESEIDQSIFSSSSVHSRSPLALYRDNIYMVPQLVRNDVSSTKVRLFVKKGMSIEYLLPGCVSKYIRRHGLYKEGFVAQAEGSAPAFPPLEVAKLRNEDGDSSASDSSGEELAPES